MTFYVFFSGGGIMGGVIDSTKQPDHTFCQWRGKLILWTKPLEKKTAFCDDSSHMIWEIHSRTLR